MDKLLSRRLFWLVNILLIAGLFAFAACDMMSGGSDSSSTPPPAPTCTASGQPCGSAGNLPCCAPTSCNRGLCG